MLMKLCTGYNESKTFETEGVDKCGVFYKRIIRLSLAVNFCTESCSSDNIHSTGTKSPEG